MKKPLLVLTALSLSLSAILSPLPATAALPLSVNGEQIPSLAPMLEKVTPAVVSIAVEGTQVSRQRLPDQFRFFFGPDFPTEQLQERPFRSLGFLGSLLALIKGMSLLTTMSLMVLKKFASNCMTVASLMQNLSVVMRCLMSPCSS